MFRRRLQATLARVTTAYQRNAGSAVRTSDRVQNQLPSASSTNSHRGCLVHIRAATIGTLRGRALVNLSSLEGCGYSSLNYLPLQAIVLIEAVAS